MPLTEDQKQKLNRSRRLHMLSHAEIEEAFAKTLESLVGGHYRVRIAAWASSEAGNPPFTAAREKIEMSATIEAYDPAYERKPDFVVA
jgi:hypothetical protein